MANTEAQRKRINQDLSSRFTHPSPTLKKKWEKRRAEKGNGQDVFDQEFEEWINERKEYENLVANYQRRLADEIWNKAEFQHDMETAHRSYLENIKLPRSQQDASCLFRLNQELSDKYHLNSGWLTWLNHCVQTKENNPNLIILYIPREKGESIKYLSLDVYFPLPLEIYEEAIIYLRLKEAETFGDYYTQEQSGGAPKGMRPSTVEKYRILADRYHKASQSHAGELTQREFCRLANIPLWKLQRALKFVANYRPKTDK